MEGAIELNNNDVTGLKSSSLEDRSERHRIAYFFMSASFRKLRNIWLEERLPSGREEIGPMEISHSTFVIGHYFLNLGEEGTEYLKGSYSLNHLS